MTKERKIVGIQYLRGLAALGVVLCHYDPSLTHYRILYSLFNRGQFGVHVFFLISGFVIVYALIENDYHPRDFFRFLLKRSLRIEPVYIASIILTLLTAQALRVLPSLKAGVIPLIPGQFLAHVFYIVPFSKWDFYNHVYWTLGVEFQFYLIVGLLYFISTNTVFRISFLLLFSFTAFIPMEKSYYLVFNYAPIFVSGMALMHYWREKNKAYFIPLAVAGVSIYIHFDWIIFLLLFITVLVILFINRPIKALAFMGSISYSLYVTHILVAVYVQVLLKKFIPDQSGLELAIFCLKVGLAIGFAFVFYRLIELPAIILSKKISYKSQ